MMVLKTCKWYQNCSPGHDASIGTQRDLPGSNFEVDLLRSLCTMWFVMAFGYLNIDLTHFLSCGSFNELSNAVCRLSLSRRFVVFEIWRRGKKGPPSARFRAFQSPPGIGLTIRKTLRNQYLKWFKSKLETNDQFLKAWQRFQSLKHFEDHFT